MTAFLEHVLRGAEALAARDPVGTLPDADLLRRFTTERDQRAFAILVRRHGPLVWGVCRNLLPRDADAEDAFQATFLALVRGAGGVRQTGALGGWLHGVAYRIAMKARRTAVRRKRRETVAAVDEADTPVADAAWDELQAAVHEEVCRLPDKLRLPFVLCTLQGHAQRDAADQLGWKIGTLSGRLSQARQRLLDRLARRGVPTAALAVGAAAGAAGVPTNLSSITFRTAMAPDRASPAVLSLARGVPLMARTKLIVAGVLIAGALTTGVGTRLLSTADAQGPPKDSNAEAIRRGIEFLHKAQAPAQDRWEYKFVPMTKAPTMEEMPKLLAELGRDGWEYCGSQPMVTSSSGKPVELPHLTFKRPRPATPTRDTASAALLAEAVKALMERKDADADPTAKATELYRKALLEAQRAQADAEQEAVRAKLLAEEQKRRAEVERQNAEKLKANKEFQKTPADPTALEVARTKALIEAEKAAIADKLRAHDAEFKKFAELQATETRGAQAKIQALEAELKLARAQAEQLARRLAEMDAARTKDTPSSAADSLTVKLTGLDGKTAAATLAKALPDAKIVAEVSADWIRLSGPTDVLRKARDILAKVQAPGPSKATDEKQTFSSITPRYVAAGEVSDVLEKIIPKGAARVIVDARTNTLLVAGPDEVLAEIKKVVAELDKPGAGPKR